MTLWSLKWAESALGRNYRKIKAENRADYAAIEETSLYQHPKDAAIPTPCTTNRLQYDNLVQYNGDLSVPLENSVGGELHLQVHLCAIQAVHIDPIPEGKQTNNLLYNWDVKLTDSDLQGIRSLIHKLQHSDIASNLAYPRPCARIKVKMRMKKSSCNV
ncbi:hypothetical protein BDN70DRAFT_937351 [Pholiota conissans]|uniref:Uncharacterized protein n=1 Tax=Pholiota conissans TaxID=109636 RepID=A0A9P6CU26_9AGAR|nr:hypothetical protein BDN70DRAFT_937351 [Pholiota conissans]